jgi:hypothetical protein
MARAKDWRERYADGVIAVGAALLGVFLFIGQGGVTWWSLTAGGFGVLLLGAGLTLKRPWRHLGHGVNRK